MSTKLIEGLGFKRIQDVNATLLAKLGWKILINPNNIWVRVVSTKYLSKVNYLEAKKTIKGFNNVEIYTCSLVPT